MNPPSLRETQSQSGATFGGNSPLPGHFGNPASEYRAATQSAALFDLSDRVSIELRGKDRQPFLHNFCTNDIKRLQPGEGCEAFLTNIKGRVVGHILVFAAKDALWLDSVPGSATFLASHLDKYVITEDVQVRDRTPDMGMLYVAGPDAASRLGPLLRASVAELEPGGCRNGSCAGVDVQARRFDFILTPGFQLVAPRDRLTDLWTGLTAAGIAPAGAAAFEALRIEAGFPHYGVDISEDNIAQEAGRTKRAISFTKGCYLGQEPIARLDAMGHVNRILRGVRLAGGPVPPVQTPVFDETGAQQVGVITSAAMSYVDTVPVALAMLRSQASKPDTQVRVTVMGGQSIEGTIFWPTE
jgi:folate-binding protein YgfZ